MLPIKEGLWRGRLTLEITEESEKEIPRFLSIAAHKGVILQKVRGKGNNPVRFEIYQKDLELLDGIKEKTNVDFRVTRQGGMPFALRFLKNHPGIPLGLLIFFVLLWLLSRFLWNISFDGNSLHTDEEIRSFLEENDVTVGIWLRDVSCEDIEVLIRNQFFDITWVSAELSGTRLTIHIKENYDMEIAQEEEDPYSLVAEKDAVITRIVTRAGTAMVKAGDTVSAGDELVSGIIRKYDEYGEEVLVEFVNADADIFGQTIYTYTDEFSMKYNKKVYTGTETKAFFLRIRKRQYTFFLSKPSYEMYDKEENVSQLHIGYGLYFPICTGTALYREYELEKSVFTQDEAKALAKIRYADFLEELEEKGVVIIEKNGTIQFGEDWCSVTSQVVCEERLGKVMPIGIEEIEEKGTADEYH